MIVVRSILLMVCVSLALDLTFRLVMSGISIEKQRSNDESSSYYHHEQSRQRQLMSLPELISDPRTVIVKEGGGEGVPATNSLFVIPEPYLVESKHALPAIVQSRPPDFDHQGLVVDVLSIGSRTRLEYMTAQINTWASHVHVRNFWGISEEQDYDPQCDQTMDNDALQSYVESCRGDMGWKDNKLEEFRKRLFGRASGKTLESRNSGWFCAQRRPGHGLGWLMEAYRNTTYIPDVLMIVDDDTSVDSENLKASMQLHLDSAQSQPFVGSGCVFAFKFGLTFAFGGFGTFFNKAAIHLLTQQIYCDRNESSQQQKAENSFNELSCASLHRNTIGELDVFQNGDTALDVFYKYSATRNFCLHSDWAIGYMVSNYLHQPISQLQPRHCSHRCDLTSIACHNHGPVEMETFVREHSSAPQ